MMSKPPAALRGLQSLRSFVAFRQWVSGQQAAGAQAPTCTAFYASCLGDGSLRCEAPISRRSSLQSLLGDSPSSQGPARQLFLGEKECWSFLLSHVQHPNLLVGGPPCREHGRMGRLPGRAQPHLPRARVWIWLRGLIFLQTLFEVPMQGENSSGQRLT